LNNTLADENATFTVFAPTDDAFAKLGEDTINALLGDVETLTQILTYHVVPNAAVDATTALSLDGQDVDTVNGESIRLTVNGDTLLVNTSQVIQTDIQATNGIIHVIDTVLMPPQAAMDPGSDAELVNIIEKPRR